MAWTCEALDTWRQQCVLERKKNMEAPSKEGLGHNCMHTWSAVGLKKNPQKNDKPSHCIPKGCRPRSNQRVPS